MEEQLAKIQSDITWLTYLVEKIATQLDTMEQQRPDTRSPEQKLADEARGMADDGYGGLI